MTQLILGTYNHLPSDIPDSVFEQTYQTCYRPFLSTLNKFPEIQVTLYYSGTLLEKLEERHPEYLMLISDMVSRRQVELLGGGFYAPLLPLVSNADRVGQIELCTTWLRKHFGKRPRGCWLYEYTWEPWLASTLQTVGMDYTFLTDRQFYDAMGCNPHTCMPVITEDQGRCITVIPTADCSRSSKNTIVGFETMFESMKTSPCAAMMMAGESIQTLWQESGLESPDVYMERTFAWLRKNALNIETIAASKYIKSKSLLPKLYFGGSASELFMRSVSKDGTPKPSTSLRQAIVRYRSAAALYSKMYYVSLVIGQLRGDKARKKSALEDLWKGQCGNAYWLTLSDSTPVGSIQDPAVRRAAYKALINAEMTTRTKPNFVSSIVRADIDFDGVKEYLYQGNDINVYIHLYRAAVFELDMLKAGKNLSDIFIPTDRSDEAHIASFIEHIYEAEPEAAHIHQAQQRDIGPFSHTLFDEIETPENLNSLEFTKESFIELQGKTKRIKLTKHYTFSKKTIKVHYTINNMSNDLVSFWLGVELNCALDATALEYANADGTQASRDIPINAMISDPLDKMTIRGASSPKFFTLASSVSAKIGIHRIHAAYEQGIGLLPYWNIELTTDGVWKTELLITLQD